MAVETLRPNAAGDECNIVNQAGCNACPDHFACVDEAVSDEYTTCIRHYSSGGGWARDFYNVADHSVGSGTINHITVHVVLISNNPPDNHFNICIKSGTGSGAPDTATNSPQQEPTNSWVDYSEQWATNPATSNPWTWDEIDKLQIGLRIYSIANASIRCTQVYVEVDYISITVKTGSDTGAGADAKASDNPQASLSKSDSGSGAESTPTETATLAGAESGSGVDALLSLLGKLVSDAGSSAENSYLDIIVGVKSSSDVGSGTDASSLLAEFERDDTGEGIEALLARLLHHADSGLGSDAVLTLLAALAGAEIGSGLDTFSGLLAALATTEAGLGGDKLLSREILLSDAGLGIDTATMYKAFLAADSGAGLEALGNLLVLITTGESGSGSEKLRAKIMTSPGAGDMKLPTKMGKAGIPSRRINL